MKSARQQVVIFQRRLPGYRVPLFEALRNRLGDGGIALQVLYGPPAPGEERRRDRGALPWGREVSGRYFQAGKSRLVWHQLPWRALLQADLVVLSQENALLANYPVLVARRLNGRPTAFWGHGANLQGDAASRRERFKAWLACRVDWWFAYTALSADRIAGLGFPRPRITNLNNAVETGSLQRWREELKGQEQKVLAAGLGLRGRNPGVFLGSLTAEKRLAFLFAAADRVRVLVPDFELLLIGDGPLHRLVELETARRPWVVWLGARQGRDKARYLGLAKVMLNPGMIGLGIIDSFVMGLPVVTTDCGVHSPEIAYLESGRNGLLTEDRVEPYAAAVAALLADERCRQRLAQACLDDANRYTLERMVESFHRGLLQALSLGI